MAGSVTREVVTLESGCLHVLTMDRPGARNAMDSGLLSELLDALDDAEGDAAVRGVLLTGAGGTFSAGADLRERQPEGDVRRRDLFVAVYERLTLLRVPTAAAVEGYAVGGGAEAAAACDLRVAAHGATFRFPGAVYGVPIGVARTVGQVGLSTAKDWVLSGRDVPADEAYRVGFVQRLVPDGHSRETALTWLSMAAGRQPAAVAVLKRLFAEQSGLRDRTAFENDALRVHAATGRLPGAPGPDDPPGTVRPRRP